MTETPSPPTRGGGPSRRLLLGIISMIGVAAVAAVAVVLLVAASSDDSLDLNASPVRPTRDAPLTQGTGHDGTPVSAPTPGRPALVTFLFANCPDVCPMISETIRQALERVGPDADNVDVVAVSVDPEGDTPAAVGKFLKVHRLDGRMDYIVGTRAELSPLWKDWMVAAQPAGENMSIHSARVVLVDADGRQVGSYPGGIAVPVADLAQDITALAGTAD